MNAVNTLCDDNANRDGLQIPDLCDADCAGAYIPVYANCHDLLQAVADQQGRAAAKIMRKFDHLNDACVEAHQDLVHIQTGDVHIDGATYFITTPVPLAQGTEFQRVPIPMDYDIGFTIVPDEATVDGWANIIHVTASGDNCCEYGDRIPAIWFYANTHRLHIRDGSAGQDGNGNDGCDPEEELVAGVPTNVKLEIRATSFNVYFNDVVKCSGDRGARLTQSTAQVFASDPWHTAALATISNFYMVCDSDTSTPGLQAEPDEDPVSICARSSTLPPPPPPAPVAGANWFIRNAVPLSQDNLVDQVDLPQDYDLGFTITPTAANVDGWANIVHVTATGNNCCEYGDRIPGVWFHPNTKRLHIRDGDSIGDGNGGCDPDEELPADQPTTITIHIRATSVEVFFNGVSKCQADRGSRTTHSAASVYASDPWHSPASATIANFYIVCDSDPAADGMQTGSGPSCTLIAVPPPPPSPSAAEAVAAAGSVEGALYLITAEQQLVADHELQQLDIPLDYDLGFTITPAADTVSEWANIIHVSATGENCCDYGDRIPGIWLYPDSHRLHVRDGSNSNGNDGCDPTDELPVGVATAVRLEIRAHSVELFFNGVSQCQADRDEDARTYPDE